MKTCLFTTLPFCPLLAFEGVVAVLRHTGRGRLFDATHFVQLELDLVTN